MRCTSPRTVGYLSDGKTLCWSSSKCSSEFANFQLPCGKCIDCRLEYARQWAVRCVHEAQMHEDNIFLTLTYSDEHLKSPKLQYVDWQKFMKKLRKTKNDPIGAFVTGEYGEMTKRPHWHAILFNYSPSDKKPYRLNERGDKCYESKTLEKLWGKGKIEIGDVTIHSAGYCARYAAKKLVHGNDQEHDYQPISKKSSKHAIGKRWIERYWRDVFQYGKLHLAGGGTTSIPRYYEKWFKMNKPNEWYKYVTDVKSKITSQASQRAQEVETAYWENEFRRRAENPRRGTGPTQNDAQRIITLQNHNLLQGYLKL